jgi:capsular polysaccharide biosynthesis protein
MFSARRLRPQRFEGEEPLVLSQTINQGQKLRVYTGIVLRWLWFLLLCTLVAGGIAFGVSRLQTPVYAASTLLIVDSQSSTDAYSNLLASDQLVSTYLSLIKTQPVMQQAASAVGGITVTQLEAATTVSNPGVSTQIIQIQVDDTNPQRAAALANAVGTAFIVIQQRC